MATLPPSPNSLSSLHVRNTPPYAQSQGIPPSPGNELPVYSVFGHGCDLVDEGVKIIPKGCYYVTLATHGYLSWSSIKLMYAFQDPTIKNALMNPLDNVDLLNKYFDTYACKDEVVEVKKPGDTYIDASISLVYNEIKNIALYKSGLYELGTEFPYMQNTFTYPERFITEITGWEKILTKSEIVNAYKGSIIQPDNLDGFMTNPRTTPKNLMAHYNKPYFNKGLNIKISQLFEAEREGSPKGGIYYNFTCRVTCNKRPLPGVPNQNTQLRSVPDTRMGEHAEKVKKNINRWLDKMTKRAERAMRVAVDALAADDNAEIQRVQQIVDQAAVDALMVDDNAEIQRVEDERAGLAEVAATLPPPGNTLPPPGNTLPPPGNTPEENAPYPVSKRARIGPSANSVPLRNVNGANAANGMVGLPMELTQEERFEAMQETLENLFDTQHPGKLMDIDYPPPAVLTRNENVLDSLMDGDLMKGEIIYMNVNSGASAAPQGASAAPQGASAAPQGGGKKKSKRKTKRKSFMRRRGKSMKRAKAKKIDPI